MLRHLIQTRHKTCSTAIGHRALLVRAEGGKVLWDMITYIDSEMIARVNDLGETGATANGAPLGAAG